MGGAVTLHRRRNVNTAVAPGSHRARRLTRRKSGRYFLRLEELLLLFERDELDFFFLVELEHDRRLGLRLRTERAAGFFAFERLVVVEPLEPEALLAGAAAGAGGGVAAGADAEALACGLPRRRPRFETVLAEGHERARRDGDCGSETQEYPDLQRRRAANMRQRISSTASAPNSAVTAPRRTGMFTRCPAAAR